jgi:hypothetical protein
LRRSRARGDGAPRNSAAVETIPSAASRIEVLSSGTTLLSAKRLAPHAKRKFMAIIRRRLLPNSLMHANGQCGPDRLATSRELSRALLECDREQARAKQHETGCGQREESVGHEVMITHGTPAAYDACCSQCWSEFIKDFGIGLCARRIAAAAEIRPSSESLQMRGQEKSRR